MPTPKEKRVTPASVIEDELGEKLVEANVARRHPISGQLQERPLLVVIVDTEDTSGLSTELAAEIYEETGTYYSLSVCTADERDDLTLNDHIL